MVERAIRIILTDEHLCSHVLELATELVKPLGVYKFNKQFLSPIPFPSQRIIEDTESVSNLAQLYDDIFALQNRYLSSNPIQKEVIANSLKSKWNELDGICYALYDLSDDQINKVLAIGRTVSRIELLGDSN